MRQFRPDELAKDNQVHIHQGPGR